LIKTAVILCGGRGQRLGNIGDKIPKIMSIVNGYPIIWYSILKLYSSGIRHFILPLGYKGEQIQGYIDEKFNQLNARIDAIHTGENSTIGKRMHMIKYLIPAEPFLLVNGDCLFDFGINELSNLHDKSSSLATLATCQIVSQYGLILVHQGKVSSFSRGSQIKSFVINDNQNNEIMGYVNAGITLLNSETLNEINLLETSNFERDLFPKLIKKKGVSFFPIQDYWFAVETAKDLDIVNGKAEDKETYIGAINLKEKLLKVQSQLDIQF